VKETQGNYDSPAKNYVFPGNPWKWNEMDLFKDWELREPRELRELKKTQAGSCPLMS